MKILENGSAKLVSGGGGGAAPKIDCHDDPITVSKSGEVVVSTSGSICQTSTGLTIIKSTVSSGVQIQGGLSGTFKGMFGLQGNGDFKNVESTETVTVCNSKGQCDTKETTTHFDSKGNKVSDAGDGFEYASYAAAEAGCVQVASFLPDGSRAGDIVVGAQMQLSDQASLEAGVGTVSYSKRKTGPGYRLTTASGVTLVCSATAPIPTPDGVVLAPQLMGKSVAVRRDGTDGSACGWEPVRSVEAVGDIEVQHITVGNKCFWAGEERNGFILHHNSKQVDGTLASNDPQTSYDNFNWDDVV